MKQELADNDKQMMAKLKELIMEQTSLDNTNIPIKRHSNELEEWQKESQEQVDKIVALQQEVAEREEKLRRCNKE